MNKFIFNQKYPIILLFVSFIFIMPQIITKSMVIGSDAIFHFNRFFETSEQIKNGNLQYFISIYGFQQSGRIVNALYSPFVAYLNGVLVLIADNWFTYQIITNFILYNIAGFSMYNFLRSGHIDHRKSLLGSLLYMCTFSILYWSTRQGFSSWGAAVMPMCLSLIFYVLEEKKVPMIKLGIYVALLVQIHMLSAFITVLIFIPVFFFAFYKSSSKKKFLTDLISAIILFILLTFNIWTAYITIAGNNKLIQPFVNKTMSLNTIDKNSYYWLINPCSLLIILIFTVIFFIKKWKHNSTESKIIFIVMMIFMLLSTSIIPWDILIEKRFFIAELIQFPFRFFTPVTIFILYLFFKISDFKKTAEIFVLLGILQVVILMFVTLSAWSSNDDFILSGPKTVFKEENVKKIKKAFFSKNKGEALELVMKSTPDYLPFYENENFKNIHELNAYELYKNNIINKNQYFKKSIVKSKLVVKEINFSEEFIEFPVIIYAGTRLTTMGTELASDQYSLSVIGTPIINREYVNNNQIEIEYNNKFNDLSIYLTLIMWGIVIIIGIYFKLNYFL